MPARKQSVNSTVQGLKQLVAVATLGSDPTSFGAALRSLRELEGVSLQAFAVRLQIPYRHLQDVEKDRRAVSVRRAAEWARILGYPQVTLVRLALQRVLDDAKLPFRIKLEAV
jgi:transcriptional regulator with XRE-family HTH domain